MPRVYLSREPFMDPEAPYKPPWTTWGEWPAYWVDHPQRTVAEPSVAAFRLRLQVAEPAVIRCHVSADNRYILLIDGALVGRGPERGDALHWRFESYDLRLEPGDHTLTALSWWAKENAPYAQMSVRPGFLLAAEGEWQDKLSTGLAPWEAMLVRGLEFIPSEVPTLTGGRIRFDATTYPWGWQTEGNGDWQPVQRLLPGMSAAYKNETPPFWLLKPATLPRMLEEWRQQGTLRHLDSQRDYPVEMSRHLATEGEAWQALLAGDAELILPAHTTRKAIIDLGDYFCAYPSITVSGGKGARIRLAWAEGLYEQKERRSKGNRHEIEGKYFVGIADEFTCDGGAHREFFTLWWQAGRYLELTVETAEEALTIEKCGLLKTRYPLEMQGQFRCEDDRVNRVIPKAVRTLQMCAHETYMDCPFYEQLMYVGDTRTEVLTTYVITADDRLPRKALEIFDESRRLSGFTQSRYPSRVTQIIPPYSLWWVCMVHDYWLWRRDPDFVRRLLPGVRSVMEAFRAIVRADGLLGVPNGWNFVDWVPGWRAGVPPDAEVNPSSIINLQLVLSLLAKAELESFFQEPLLAERDLATAHRTLKAVLRSFWDEGRGLIADDLGHTAFSEHAQVLAILTQLLDNERLQRLSEGLLSDSDLAQTTIYFRHYLFDAFFLLGRSDQILQRLTLWFELDDVGVTTLLEQPEPSRSDCHAWGAHPLYHYYASLLGIRPDAPGFSRVRIAPQPGGLEHLEGRMPHPQGDIAVEMERKEEAFAVRVSLPPETPALFVWGGMERQLLPGLHSFVVPCER